MHLFELFRGFFIKTKILYRTLIDFYLFSEFILKPLHI